MRPPIDGAVVLITGASSGIGREMARILGGRASALALVARRTDRLDALKAELIDKRPNLKVGVYGCDLVDDDAAVRIFADVERDLGPVDVLINNAGFGDFGPFDEADWDKTIRMLKVNVVTLTRLTHVAVRGMVARGRGGVLNVSSAFGLQFLPAFAAYIGTKQYVTGFTESVRLDLRSRGVVVTQLCPGPVETEFVENARLGKAPPPRIVMISAERCAREALAGFEKGRALIIPGILMRVILALGAITPRFVLRLIYAPFAAHARTLK